MRLIFALFLGWAILAVTGCKETRESSAFEKNWQRYAQQFYQNGRIVDTGNDNVSHSEGQGYGMLFAAQAGDRERFDAIWQWTKKTLQRDDYLFSWRYRPCPLKNAACIDDTNNASDGDILIAWALLRAIQQWEREQYRTQALQIINSIEQKLVVEAHGYTVLLPAQQGFTQSLDVQLNLSYWIFPAFTDFYTTTGKPVWKALNTSGHQLLGRVAAKKPGLPGDWMWLSKQKLTVKNAINQQYGFNACRIPLHLIWQKPIKTPLLQPYLEFWQQHKIVPATLNLQTGEPAEYRWSNGMQAIAQAVRFKLDKRSEAPTAIIAETDDYFSASLIMLSQLSLADTEL